MARGVLENRDFATKYITKIFRKLNYKKYENDNTDNDIDEVDTNYDDAVHTIVATFDMTITKLSLATFLSLF